MALIIKDPETERLAAEIAAPTGESKTRAVHVALAERRERLHAPAAKAREARLLRFMEDEFWPPIPAELRRPLTMAEREEILGIGPDGP